MAPTPPVQNERRLGMGESLASEFGSESQKLVNESAVTSEPCNWFAPTKMQYSVPELLGLALLRSE
jgi:hypothetical protein